MSSLPPGESENIGKAAEADTTRQKAESKEPLAEHIQVDVDPVFAADNPNSRLMVAVDVDALFSGIRDAGLVSFDLALSKIKFTSEKPATYDFKQEKVVTYDAATKQITVTLGELAANVGRTVVMGNDSDLYTTPEAIQKLVREKVIAAIAATVIEADRTSPQAAESSLARKQQALRDQLQNRAFLTITGKDTVALRAQELERTMQKTGSSGGGRYAWTGDLPGHN